jgi:hypothetical protein
MNCYFKNALLATSCLVVSLSVSHPGFSMDVPQDKPEKSVVKSNKSVQKTNKDEGLFSKTKYGNWKFDQKKWVTVLLQSKEDESKREHLFEVLIEAASEGDADALERLYAFSTKDMLGLKKKSEQRAAQTLRRGLLREQAWVVPIYQGKIQGLQTEAGELLRMKKLKGKIEGTTPGQQELLRLLREVANTPLVEPNLVKYSESVLEALFPFDGFQWLSGYCKKEHKETIEQMVMRLKGYGYYKHFYNLHGLASTLKVNRNKPLEIIFFNSQLQFLQAGTDLGDVAALNKLYHYYKKDGQEQKAREALHTLAIERGKVESLFNFGLEYSRGDLVEKDEQKAIELYAKAADQGFHVAIFELIKRWYSNGPHQDLTKAFQGLCEIESKARELAKAQDRKRDELDPGSVFMMLGRCYLYGQGVTQDKKQAAKYFQEGAELREKNSLLHLARAYQEGEGVEKNFKEAIQYWKTVSTKDPKEIVWMGRCYEERGFELQQAGDSNSANEHFKLAYASYQQAAKKKDPQALYNMASHHYQGLARKKNLGEAIKLFNESANAENVEAMYSLGYINLFELNDIKLAEKWLQKAVGKGHLVAMVDLGWLHETKHQNIQTAFDLYKKSADLGNAIAQFNYGLLLLGTRLSEDHTIEDRENVALSYLHKSAEQNFSKAMILLAKYYLERSSAESETGRQNLESAYFWLQKAANLDNFEAKTLLKELESKVENEVGESVPSQDLTQCLENLENIENGRGEYSKELEIKVENRIFDDLVKEHDKSESSDDESELLTNPSEKEALKISSLAELQTTELTELEGAGTAPISQIDQEETVDLWKQFIPPNKTLFKNPKFLRQQLREAGLAFKMKEQECQKFQDVKLSPGSSEIIRMLKSKKEREDITYGSLHKLFTDPYFTNRGHVSLHKTASGIAISAKCFEKMKALSVEDVMTTGTHHNHNKTYKGYNPVFLKNVVRVLEIFGI